MRNAECACGMRNARAEFANICEFMFLCELLTKFNFYAKFASKLIICENAQCACGVRNAHAELTKICEFMILCEIRIELAKNCTIKKKYRRPDSNPRPPKSETETLTTELQNNENFW